MMNKNRPLTKEEIMKLLKDGKYLFIIRGFDSNTIEILEVETAKPIMEIILKYPLPQEFDWEEIEKNIERIYFCFKILKKIEKGEYTYCFGKCLNKYALLRKRCWSNYKEGEYAYLFGLKFDRLGRLRKTSSSWEILRISTNEDEIKKELILWGLSNE